MDYGALSAILFGLAAYVLVGLLLIWLLGRQEIVRCQSAIQEREEATPEPGTFGNKRPNSRVIALLDQVDELIKRLDEEEMDALMEEMQRRAW